MVVRENMKNHLQQREHNQRERQITVNTEELSGYGYLCWKNRHRAECTKDLLFKGIFWCYLLFRLILFSACLKQALRFPGEVSGQRHSAQAFCAGSYNATARLTSPAKNVWLVVARPRDIAKFKMAAKPLSFVYFIGKKINCGVIWVANAYTDIFRIA